MKRTNPLKPLRRLSRGIRLVLGGGLAVGAGFGLVTGVSAAATSSPGTVPRPAAIAPARGPGPGGHAPNGGPAAPGPLGTPGGPGGAGTITHITGTTLTLRTENGTETVDTSSTTKYRKEMQTVAFGALGKGDVVRITGNPPSTGSSTISSPPPQPGTGTVEATRITIVEPSFAGRVSSIGSGGYTLVGRDGQLLTVSTTASTRYYDGTAQSSASSISVGSRVVAEGTRDSLDDLTADVVVVAPPPSPPAGALSPPSAPTSPAPGNSTGPPS